MGVNRLIHSFDESLTNLSLRVGRETNYLISFLFHGLFAGADEVASGTVDPQQAITVDMFRTLVVHFKSHSYRFVSPVESRCFFYLDCPYKRAKGLLVGCGLP